MSSQASGLHQRQTDTGTDTMPPFPKDVATAAAAVVASTSAPSVRPPAVRVRDGRLDPQSAWPPTDSQRQGVERTLGSVGRIHQDEMTLGTGFLVAPTIVMTNRHVAESFCTNVDGTLKIRIGWNPTIDFIAELLPKEAVPQDPPQAARHGAGHGMPAATGHAHAEPPRARFRVKSVLFCSDRRDLALLRVDLRDPVSPLPTGGWKTPDPLPLTFEQPIPAPTDIYLVGFPTHDVSASDEELTGVFGNIFDVKRVQPGRCTNIDDKELRHDASTLRGNSGSCVVDLQTHRVVGVHYQGSREKKGAPALNLAIALWLLDDHDRSRLEAAGVSVGGASQT